MKPCFNCIYCKNPKLVKEKKSKAVICKKKFANPMTGCILQTTCWNARKHTCFCGYKGIFWERKCGKG